eukprot:490703_1
MSTKKPIKITKDKLSNCLRELETKLKDPKGVTYYRLSTAVATKLDLKLTASVTSAIRETLHALKQNGLIVEGSNKNRYKSVKIYDTKQTKNLSKKKIKSKKIKPKKK